MMLQVRVSQKLSCPQSNEAESHMPIVMFYFMVVVFNLQIKDNKHELVHCEIIKY